MVQQQQDRQNQQVFVFSSFMAQQRFDDFKVLSN